MSNPFFDHPILNSPYERPSRHWELDESGQPTQQILAVRRRAQFITPIPKPRKQKKSSAQQALIRDYCGRVGVEVAEPSAPTAARQPAAKTKKKK